MISLIRSFRTALTLPWRYKWLAIQIFFELTQACIELKIQKFQQLANKLGLPESESTHELTKDDDHQYQRMLKGLTRRIAELLPWKCVCFPQAIAAQRLLDKKNIHCTLYLGLKKENDEMTAHAWVRSGQYIVTGDDGVHEFTIINSFTKRPKG